MTQKTNLVHDVERIRLKELNEVVHPWPNYEPKGVKESGLSTQVERDAENVHTPRQNIIFRESQGALILWEAEETFSVFRPWEQAPLSLIHRLYEKMLHLKLSSRPSREL